MPTRVLTPGLLAGIRPVSDARELTTFDLGLYGGADVRPVTGIRDPSYGVDIPLPPAPRLLPAAIQQNPMHQVLPRQGLADAVRIGKPQRADDTEGMYPKGLYRFKLQQGTYNQATGQQPFQNPPAAALNFPLGVVHPYVNNLPLNTPVFTVGRKTNATYSPGFTGRILAWGINNSTTGFEDQCLYDPCNMRAAWDAGVNAFLGVSTPGAFRASETKGIFRVECWVEGNFAAQNASNRLNVAVWQYRSGVFLRQLLLGISNNAQGQAMSCHRVIMSQDGYGEDFEPTTDHNEVMFENANASTNDFDLTLFQGQIYWYPAL